MPASTPLGLTYPCSGDTIDPAAFATYANTAQTAITATEALADQALYPPAAQARRVISQNFNAGVTTALSWDIEAYDTDPASLIFVAGGSVMTVQQTGTYLIGVWTRTSQQPADMTSTRVAIVVNGVEFSANKGDSGATLGTTNTEAYTATLAPNLAPGTTIGVNYLYTGAASPIGIDSTLSVIRINPA
jgi:hypothetical protein